MATVLDLVKHYQNAIEKYPNDEQKILKSIDKLFNLDVTVQHLQETGVGRTVNALRKEPGDVGHAARALVYKWKLMVAAEESDQDVEHSNDTATYNGHENGKDSDDNGRQQSRNKYDRNEKASPAVKTEHKELNGNYSGGKRKNHSSEDEEPDIKKSRSNSNNHDDYKRKTVVQVKREPESEDESDSDHSHSEDSDSDESEYSRDEGDSKIKQEKEEPTDYHKSYSSKHTSTHKSTEDHKRESSSSKRSHDSEKHLKRHHSSEPVDKHSSEKSSAKEKSHSSHKHKSSKEKEKKDDKNSKSETSLPEKDKKHKEDSKSSSKHKSSSDKHKSSNSDNSNDKNKTNHDKQPSKSEKHRSSSHSQKSEKDKHKSSSDKEVPDDKHKSKHSSSSKEKHSSSSKERSKERSSSSKEKTDGSKEAHHSHKSEKKHTSSDSKSKHSDSKHKSEKHDGGSNDTKSKHKSSSSSSHKSKSSSKSKEDVPKKKNQTSNADSDDGIGCESGASFAEALGMVSPAKPKKKPVPGKESLPMTPSNSKDLSPANLLAPTAKLAPLVPLEISALPDISPNYKPRPPPKLMPHFTEEEALSSVISSKNQRTKVYSGNKVIGKIPTLYEMCVQILQEHIDALEYTGGVPYDILKPVVDRATPQQLFVLEHFNPYLMEDTDHLWEQFCKKNFRNKQRHEMETWREMYMRCQEEQEHRLKSLTANIRMTQEAKKAPIKQTKMAYVDSVVKPPRNIARKQALHGTAHAASASPAARVASLAAAPNVLRGNTRPSPAAPASSSFKPKKAPLMQKALQFMRGRKR